MLEEALEDDIMDDICEDETEDMVMLLADWADEEEPPAAAPPDAPLTDRTPPYTSSGTVLVPAVDAATMNAPIFSLPEELRQSDKRLTQKRVKVQLTADLSHQPYQLDNDHLEDSSTRSGQCC